MYAKIMIGEKEVELAANAATPFFYTAVFKKDLMKEQAPLFSGKTDPAESFGLVNELAFIMAMNAQRSMDDMLKLTQDDYIGWLSGFEVFDLMSASQNILAVYLGNNKMLSKSKKEGGRQTGRTQ